jgi:hypothetical protein
VSDKDVCSECIWSEPALPHCIDVRKRGYLTCDRFWPATPRNDPNHCGNCDRDKDPGKCWWCGEIDA